MDGWVRAWVGAWVHVLFVGQDSVACAHNGRRMRSARSSVAAANIAPSFAQLISFPEGVRQLLPRMTSFIII